MPNELPIHRPRPTSFGATGKTARSTIPPITAYSNASSPPNPFNRHLPARSRTGGLAQGYSEPIGAVDPRIIKVVANSTWCDSIVSPDASRSNVRRANEPISRNG